MVSVASIRSNDCPDEESLWRYADRRSSGTERDALEKHLTTCSMCRAALGSFGGSRAGATDALSESEGIPEKIDGRYRIEKRLGSGASATVYLAEDERTGTRLALKLFRDGASERVVQELLLARRVSHPNVCRVYDAGVVGGVAYLSMEYVDGETLAERAVRFGGAPDPEAPRITRAILEGLAAAHDAKVVHRDLKPQNVLVDASGRVVLTDFGLARFAGQEESRARLVGTPSTWSPEQSRGEPATFASDVYSFGVVVYRLLTGQAFKLSAPKPFADVPPAYRTLLKRALELSPVERCADARVALSLLPKDEARSWSVRRASSVAFALVLVLGTCAVWLARSSWSPSVSVGPGTIASETSSVSLKPLPSASSASGGPEVGHPTFTTGAPLAPPVASEAIAPAIASTKPSGRASPTVPAPTPKSTVAPKGSVSSTLLPVPPTAPASDLLYGH
jgi:serine/threonine protein kinase